MSGIEALGRLIAAAGIGGRRARLVVTRLAEEPQTTASLVAASGVDRRTVESVLAAVGPDLVDAGGGRVGIAPERVGPYRALVVDDAVRRPFDGLLDGQAALVEDLRELVERAPAARRALDHVPATAETVALRALWLDASFELAGARVLLVGDHDLTSLALARVQPGVELAVVDIDDAVLEYIDALEHPNVRCRWADVRFGLPEPLRGWADLVVTDPPYTPEGVRAFLSRGLQGLSDHEQARLVLAYGFGEQPALGLKVQEAVTALGLAYEAILPGFNRYHGAQAVGARSDLAVLRPTARSRKIADPARARIAIYTHGSQSLEAGGGASLGEDATALLAAAAGPEQLPVATLAPHELFAEPAPGTSARRPTGVAVDLRADPGTWLLRALLSVNAPRLAVLVPNNHPDLADEQSQRALVDLIRPKYELRLRRSTPGPRLAIVEATATQLDAAERAPRAVRGVFDRAHGKLGNIWREALARADEAAGGVLTRNEARERIRTVVSPGLRDRLDERLLALPRHRIADLVGDVTASAAS